MFKYLAHTGSAGQARHASNHETDRHYERLHTLVSCIPQVIDPLIELVVPLISRQGDKRTPHETACHSWPKPIQVRTKQMYE